MSAPAGSILPSSYFDGLSQLWGASAYVAASIATAGFVFTSITRRHDPVALISLFTKIFFVGLATVFLREWLMRLGDIVSALGNYFGIDPTTVDEKYIQFMSGVSPSKPGMSAWDVIWDTGSVGTAITYAFLWLFGWLAYAVQFIVRLVGDILLSAGWALSPLFLSFFMLRAMAPLALKYLTGLIALVSWPFGWVMAAVVTNAMLDAASTASLVPVVVPGSLPIAPALTVLLIGFWLIASSVLAPYVTYRVLTAAANPAATFGQGMAGVFQAMLAGGVGGAAAAVSGGAGTAGVVTAATIASMAGGAESAARGGGSPRTTATATGGMAGFFGGRFMRHQTAAMQDMAAADTRRAAAAEAFTAQFAEHARRSRQQNSGFSQQPHHPDPNQAAIDIEAHVKE